MSQIPDGFAGPCPANDLGAIHAIVAGSVHRHSRSRNRPVLVLDERPVKFLPRPMRRSSRVCEMKKNRKSNVRTTTRTTEAICAAEQLRSGPRCGVGILRAVRVPMVFAAPALLLLSSPFSGTGTPVHPEGRILYVENRWACALLLRGNPSELGSHTTSHPMNARDESEAHPTKPNFLIANPELEFNPSPTNQSVTIF